MSTLNAIVAKMTVEDRNERRNPSRTMKITNALKAARVRRSESCARMSLLWSWSYDAAPTTEGVSRATTRTVVYASLAVLGLDFVLTALMFGDT